MITTESTRLAYENRWMRVREDTIIRADGSHGVYGVVEKDDFVVVVPVDGSQVWLVEQYRYPIRQRRWEFPQGSLEHLSAPDPLLVATAELAEETGLAAGRLDHLGRFHQAYGYSNQAAEVFVALDLTPVERRLAPEEGDLVARPFPVATVEAMLRSGEITDAATLATWTLLILHRPELLRHPGT
jgi:8-oxo-dGTP pyrophosphatase MutT (NUDIX family)